MTRNSRRCRITSITIKRENLFIWNHNTQLVDDVAAAHHTQELRKKEKSIVGSGACWKDGILLEL